MLRQGGYIMISGSEREGARKRAAGSQAPRRLGVWMGAVALSLLGIGAVERADAQVSGSIQIGQSSAAVTSDGGQTDYRNQSGSLTASFGRGFGLNTGRRSPYGRMNYGRSGLYDYGDDLDGFVAGVPRDPQ